MITDLSAAGLGKNVLPRPRYWERGEQAKPLREFLKAIG